MVSSVKESLCFSFNLVYFDDMSLFGDMNAVYGDYFPSDPPARAAFAVKELPLKVMVEIEAVAMM